MKRDGDALKDTGTLSFVIAARILLSEYWAEYMKVYNVVTVTHPASQFCDYPLTTILI